MKQVQVSSTMSWRTSESLENLARPPAILAEACFRCLESLGRSVGSLSGNGLPQVADRNDISVRMYGYGADFPVISHRCILPLPTGVFFTCAGIQAVRKSINHPYSFSVIIIVYEVAFWNQRVED